MIKLTGSSCVAIERIGRCILSHYLMILADADYGQGHNALEAA